MPDSIPWYVQWSKEIAAGCGVVSLGVLKLIGNKELARRSQYVTVDTMNECKKEILGAIDKLDMKMDGALGHAHERIDRLNDK